MERMTDMRDYKFVACRALRHAWDEEGAEAPRRTREGTAVAFPCLRGCPVIRIDVMSRATGEVVDREYVYPKDGSYTDVMGEVTDFRKEMLRRMVEANNR